MNRPTLLTSLVLIVGATGSYSLVFMRDHERTADADDALREELDDLRAERERLENELRSAHSIDLDQQAPRPCTPAVESVRTPATNAAEAAMRAALAGSVRPRELSPEQREFTIRHRYGSLFRELDLSDDQVNALLRVLAEQERRAGSSRGEPGALDGREPPPENDAERERDRVEIAGAIGADNAVRFERLKQTLPARAELRRVHAELEDLGEPMSDEQHRALLDIMTTHPPSMPPARADGESSAAAYQRLRSWFGERDRRLREDAASVLTTRQLERLEESQSTWSGFSTMPPAMADATHGARAGSGG